ncbi:MAG TPA: FAD-dependent oxidoreductase [Streptosporangiaceae bacterium]|nr:FAD-dependent oxidoreductase [Streptosporangiaceae bacterium]
MSDASEVVVLGAGVCGLTTGICLAEAGLRVTIRTDRLPLETTSAASGAIWGPHLVEDSERVARWAQATLTTLLDLAGQRGTGVRMMSGVEAWREPAQPPAWSAMLPETGPAGRLPEGYVDGWRYTAPVVTMPVYLGYLLDRFTASGGRLRVAPAGSLAGVTAATVVNCTGVAARHLVPDAEVLPIRGQVVLVTNPGITEFFVGVGDDTREVTYLFPHGDTVLLGGTEQRGDWNTEPDQAIAKRILADCVAAEPRLAGAAVVGHRVGLRPFRPLVRLEAERSANGRRLVHNYGHGGAGVTLAWGCARDVAALVSSFM